MNHNINVDIRKLIIECGFCFTTYRFVKLGKNAEEGHPDYAIYHHPEAICEAREHTIEVDINE